MNTSFNGVYKYLLTFKSIKTLNHQFSILCSNESHGSFFVRKHEGSSKVICFVLTWRGGVSSIYLKWNMLGLSQGKKIVVENNFVQKMCYNHYSHNIYETKWYLFIWVIKHKNIGSEQSITGTSVSWSLIFPSCCLSTITLAKCSDMVWFFFIHSMLFVIIISQ